MRVALVLNARAGRHLAHRESEARVAELVAALAQRGVEATAHLRDGSHLTETARELATSGRVDAVVAAGGDGTVSAVAAGIAGTGVALGVVPLGTLNHFAKDLGVRTVDAALDAIAAGKTAQVDVGEVNGRVFVNNSSIGLYPEMVVEREVERRRTGVGKWVAMLRAALRVLLRFPLLHVAIALAGDVFSARTPFVFIGNNEYERGVRELGSRRRLDRGRLAVYTVRATRRLHVVGVLLRALVRGGEPPDLEVHTVSRADIVANRRSLRVALDGEVVRMRPPLTYRARPGALRVLAPVEAT